MLSSLVMRASSFMEGSTYGGAVLVGERGGHALLVADDRPAPLVGHPANRAIPLDYRPAAGPVCPARPHASGRSAHRDPRSVAGWPRHTLRHSGGRPARLGPHAHARPL